MERWIRSWFSERLQKEMPIPLYGHYGFALLLVPAAAADFLEYERFQLIGGAFQIVAGQLRPMLS